MIAISNNLCCAGCRYWKMGPIWQSGKYGIECKGTCHAKKNIRKRGNYTSAFKCKFFILRESRSIIITGDEPLNFTDNQ